MNWKLKATVLNVLSVVPFGSGALLQLQKRVTREMPRRPEAIAELLTAARRIVALYEEHTGARAGADSIFLEIGAGRDLAVALALRMLGIGQVVSLDVNPLARVAFVQHAAEHLARMTGVACPVFSSWDDVAAFGVRYVAPAALNDWPDSSERFNCFYSTDTLEHIPPSALRSVIAASAGLLSPTGVCIHAIDYSDHYARAQSGLSRFNFLTFSDRKWKRFNPSLHYVNRLRHSQFVDLFDQCGFDLIHSEPTVQNAEQPILDRLAPEFRRFGHEDLFTLRSWLVGSPRPSAS